MAGSVQIAPRVPQAPSGISVGKTQTRGATSSNGRFSARATASVTCLTSQRRDSSVYCPSGTDGMIR